MQEREEKGFTIIELLCVMVLISVLSATAIYNLKSIGNPLSSASYTLENFLQLARSRAISGTHIVKVQPASNHKLEAFSSDSCTGTMTKITALFLELPTDADLTDTTKTVCFTQRGLTSTTTSFTIQNSLGETKTVKIALGGGTKIE